MAVKIRNRRPVLLRLMPGKKPRLTIPDLLPATRILRTRDEDTATHFRFTVSESGISRYSCSTIWIFLETIAAGTRMREVVGNHVHRSARPEAR